MNSVDWPIVGARVAALRRRRGQSLREVALRAGIDKNTLVRLEKGLPVRMKTLYKVCDTLGTTPGRQLLSLPDPDVSYRICRTAERTWGKALENVKPEDPAADVERLRSEDFRWRLGWNGRQGGFNGYVDNELFGGSIVSSLIELFTLSTIKSFEGEEFLYCLRGEVVLFIGSERNTLTEGDAVCIRAMESHRCGPLKPLKFGQAPPMILSVRVLKAP